MQCHPRPGISILNRFDPAAGLENILTAREQYEIEGGRGIFGVSEDKDGNIWASAGLMEIPFSTIDQQKLLPLQDFDDPMVFDNMIVFPRPRLLWLSVPQPMPDDVFDVSTDRLI